MNIDDSNKACWLHLWKLDSACINVDLDSALASFAEDEILHSKKFIYKPDSERYLTAHYFLRKVMQRYLKMPMPEIKFTTGLNGKPFLIDHDLFSLYFNLSYRDSFFLLGVSNRSTIGVDVEKIRKIEDVNGFCKNYFSEKESEKIKSAKAPQDQLNILFTFWTMKEAVIKALAVGFKEPLTNYDLSVFIESPVSFPGFDLTNAWTIGQIQLGEKYKAAFAVNSKNVTLETFDYKSLP